MKHKTINKCGVCCDPGGQMGWWQVIQPLCIVPLKYFLHPGSQYQELPFSGICKVFLSLFPALVVLILSLMNSRLGRFLLSYTPSSHQHKAKIASVRGNLNISPFPPHKSSTKSTQVRADTALCG